MRRKRALIVRIAALGDLVMASSLVARLRAEHDDVAITWLCGEGGADIVALFEGVDEVVTVNEERLFSRGVASALLELGRLWRVLAFRFFDQVLLCHPDVRFRALILPLRYTRLHRVRGRPSGSMIPIPGRYLPEEYARLADGAPSTGPLDRRFDIADLRDRVPDGRALLRATAGTRSVTLVPGGARNALRENPLRRWPVDYYVRLAERLLASGCSVALVGDRHDLWVGQHFAGLAITNLIGTLSLRESLSALRGSDVVVSHDTGPMHLARLVRTPCVALFGPTPPAQFVREGPATIVIWGGQRLACRPCYDGRDFAACADNRCMSGISVDEVFDCALRVLQANGAGRSARTVS
jgi:heptosyltransferase-2